jgi:methylmalonyl-CoA mutase cobalamin-binding subunit
VKAGIEILTDCQGRENDGGAMDCGPLNRIREYGVPREADVVALAIKALSVVAAGGTVRPKRSREDRVGDLCEAVIAPDDSRRHAVIAQMIASGITSTDIAEVFVPLTARKLGEAWVDDTLSFSQVTIGATRLQEMVRALGKGDLGNGVTVPLGHRVLLVIPPEEDHTLGAFVAANQFRRYGLWVHLAIGQTPAEVAETVMSQHFEMIGISGAGRRALDSVRQLVSTVKLQCPNCAPVVVGGNVCSFGDHVQEFTGADFVTTSPRKAMGFCGLTARPEQIMADTEAGYRT